MLLRRLLLFVAVLLGLTALAASIAPRESTREGGNEPAQVKPLPSPSPSPGAARRQPPPPGVDVRATLSERALKTRRVRARVGQVVRLEVQAFSTDFVAIKDIGVMEPTDPDAPTELEFLADRTGTFAVTVSERDRPIGVIDVQPAAR